MCWLSDIFKKNKEEVQEAPTNPEEPSMPEEPEIPDWITQTKEEVAEAELYAASTHYAWMVAIEEGRMSDEEIAIGGDYNHHEYWYKKHTEAAWFTAPGYTEKRLGKK